MGNIDCCSPCNWAAFFKFPTNPNDQCLPAYFHVVFLHHGHSHASIIFSNGFSGYSGQYFNVLNSDSENGLSLLTDGRLNDGTTPKSCNFASMVADFMGEPLSECNVIWFFDIFSSPSLHAWHRLPSCWIIKNMGWQIRGIGWTVDCFLQVWRSGNRKELYWFICSSRKMKILRAFFCRL